MKRKQIYLLIGQKGSGKSFIGNLFEKNFGIKFIRVEDWAKRIKKERAVDNEEYLMQVFDEIEKGVRNCSKESDKLVFESTGLTQYFDRMIQNLSRDFRVTTIGVYADSKTCLRRVKSRDQDIHINVSDDQVFMINEKVRQRNYKSDFLVINENKSKEELINEVAKIVRAIEM
ncbi:MAG: shikimate kinase [Ignavibacterium sp.]|jgi:shikimate kinase|nr:shikimate kinase [Ignavibacterium sp.]